MTFFKMLRRCVAFCVVVATANLLNAQSAAPQFDVVSIKRNTEERPNASTNRRPDGGLTMSRISVSILVAQAYPDYPMTEMVGLPDWAMREYYDVAATASLTNPTLEDRAAMMRAMLADRCKLVVHVEPRERDVSELVVARKDGRLGPGITRSDTDCSQPTSMSRARPDLSVPPPPCTVRLIGTELRDAKGEPGDLLEGDAPLDRFVEALRIPNGGHPVVNNTGLAGSYRLRLLFNLRATLGFVDDASSTNEAPVLKAALVEQLGLKLQTSRMVRDTLIIDRIERPTPN